MGISSHNREAEAAVIGAVLIDHTVLPEIADKLVAEDFYVEAHKIAWGAITALESRGSVPDLVTVTDYLRDAGKLKTAGGASTLSSLVDSTPAVANVKHYAEIVKRDSTSRNISRLLMDVQAEDDPDAAVDLLQAGIDSMSGQDARTTVSLGDVAALVADRARRMSQGRELVRGRPSGFLGIDRYITTLHPGELYIIAARPSVGKTSLACNIAANVAKKGGRVLFVSLEMTSRELAERLVAAQAEVDTRSFRSGEFNLDGIPNDIERAEDTAKVFLDWDITIDDRSGATAQQIRALARRVNGRGKLDLIVVDYLQLMDGPGNTKNEVIGNISRAMKRLAKDLDVPVILLSQLSRLLEVEGRTHRPRLSDLRDSGSIEQDADKVIFIVRDKNETPRIAQVQIAKNRQGPIGDAPLNFNPQISLFEDGSWEDHVSE